MPTDIVWNKPSRVGSVITARSPMIMPGPTTLVPPIVATLLFDFTP